VTQTISITTTVDVPIGPTPISYAACGPDNILTSYNGRHIKHIAFLETGFIFLGKQSSAYDCCVVCLNTPNCASSVWFYPNCVGAKPPGACNASLVSGEFTLYSHDESDLALSNGKCGQWKIRGDLLPAHWGIIPEWAGTSAAMTW
jgi:hypothetical protein